MADEQKYASHEDIEKWMRDQPIDVLARIPDNVESREAARLIDVAAELAHQAREKKPDRPS